MPLAVGEIIVYTKINSHLFRPGGQKGMPNRRLILISTLALIVFLACGTLTPPPAMVYIPPETLAEQTWSAMQKIAALSATATVITAPDTETPVPSNTPTITFTPTPTNTPIPPLTQRPTFTPQPTATNTPIPSVTRIPSSGGGSSGGGSGGGSGSGSGGGSKPCLAAKLVRHITIPDGSIIPRNRSFTKVWRIQNTGSCTWDSSIRLAPVSGSNPFSGSAVKIPERVRPGKSIDLAVNLVTPSVEGNYTGLWILRTSGETFGDGGNRPFRVIVLVTDSRPDPIYDFAANRCQALWQSNARMNRNRCQLTTGSGSTLPCNGRHGNPVGFVDRIDNPTMESGPVGGLPGLWTNPPIVTGGVVQGTFPALLIQSGDHFTAQVGCLEGNPNCNVNFELRYQVIVPPNSVVSENSSSQDELYDGSLSSFNINLNSLSGQYVSFIFRVTANNDQQENAAVWVAPRIAP